jgi:hypothetical protein
MFVVNWSLQAIGGLIVCRHLKLTRGVWIPGPRKEARPGVTASAYTPRAMSRTRPSVSSIIAAVTSRWVQALIRPSIIASKTPR